VGAGLVYTSAASDINCMKLQKYILSKLYPESISFTSEIEVRFLKFKIITVGLLNFYY